MGEEKNSSQDVGEEMKGFLKAHTVWLVIASAVILGTQGVSHMACRVWWRSGSPTRRHGPGPSVANSPKCRRWPKGPKGCRETLQLHSCLYFDFIPVFSPAGVGCKSFSASRACRRFRVASRVQSPFVLDKVLARGVTYWVIAAMISRTRQEPPQLNIGLENINFGGKALKRRVGGGKGRGTKGRWAVGPF